MTDKLTLAASLPETVRDRLLSIGENLHAGDRFLVEHPARYAALVKAGVLARIRRKVYSLTGLGVDVRRVLRVVQ